MYFDPDNAIVKLCAEGMGKEQEGQPAEAAALFDQAWQQATSDFEKFTAAHYVARHQSNAADKLKWDETALQLALNIKNEEIKGVYPSLYLNIAKGYEDLQNPARAKHYYELAQSLAAVLPGNGYGDMIRFGISNGLKRVQQL